MLKRLRPDVVHTHHSSDAWIFGISARLLGIPVIRGRHITLPFKKSFFKNLVYTHLADAFTVSCTSIKEMMIETGIARSEEIFITHAGVNFDKFDIGKIDRLYLRRELGIPSDSFCIGTVCFLRSWKGVDTLMEAFGILVERYKNSSFYLIIAGKGTERLKDTDVYKRHYERIFILGHRDDAENVIGGLDLFVLASKKSEATSQVIPQAMALKVLCIGSNIGGIPDVIKDGITGWLIRPDNPLELADKILYVYNLSSQERQKIIENAYNMVTKELTIKNVVDKYFKAYNIVIKKQEGKDERTYF